MKKILLVLALAAWAVAQTLQVSVDLPANGATVEKKFALSGTATPSIIVECTGDLRGSVYADKDGKWTIPLDATSMATGTVVNLTVQARDNANNRSRAVQVKYALKEGTADEVQILLSVNRPANGATVDNKFRLTGTATPSMIVECTGTLRGSVYADKDGNWAIPLDATSVASGAIIDLTVVAKDSYGHQSSPVTLKYARR